MSMRWDGGGGDYIQLAQDRDSCEYNDEPSGSGAAELVMQWDGYVTRIGKMINIL
jgi:hypothetical protein